MPAFRLPLPEQATMIDLRAEHRAAVAALTDESRGVLEDLGIPPADIGRFNMCGVARVAVERQLYTPHPDGNIAVITPVRIEHPASPESRRPAIFTQWGQIVDLIAWHPSAPEQFALRVGSAEWLGCTEPQYLEPDPVPVHRSVLDWLRAERHGLVLLSDDPAACYRALCCCHGGIVAADDTHRRHLRRILSRPWPHPAVEARDVAA